MFSTTEPGPDREAASKARKRRRIVDAARELLAERAGTDFSVEEVAERAGLSRRTIFNYFPSVDDLLVEVGTEMLGGLVATLRVADGAPVADPATEDVRAALFAELAEALHTVDLVPAMVQLTQVLGGVRTHPSQGRGLGPADLRAPRRPDGHGDPRAAPGGGPAGRRAPRRLAGQRAGGALPALERRRRASWTRRRSRATWSELLDRLVTNVGNGYLHGAPASQNH